MKKIFSILIITILALSMFSCDKNDTVTKEETNQVTSENVDNVIDTKSENVDKVIDTTLENSKEVTTETVTKNSDKTITNEVNTQEKNEEKYATKNEVTSTPQSNVSQQPSTQINNPKNEPIVQPSEDLQVNTQVDDAYVQHLKQVEYDKKKYALDDEYRAKITAIAIKYAEAADTSAMMSRVIQIDKEISVLRSESAKLSSQISSLNSQKESLIKQKNHDLAEALVNANGQMNSYYTTLEKSYNDKIKAIESQISDINSQIDSEYGAKISSLQAERNNLKEILQTPVDLESEKQQEISEAKKWYEEKLAILNSEYGK